MRAAFAHDAVLVLHAGADPAAPGGAVTVALCGAFDHPRPCPLAPHHTAVETCGDTATVRVVFAAVPQAEAVVRGRIHAALAAGTAEAPDGSRHAWTLRTSAAGAVRESDRALAARLVTD